LFVNNGVIVHSIPTFSIYVKTNAAFGRILTNYVAVLWDEVGQPWLYLTASVSYSDYVSLFRQGII